VVCQKVANIEADRISFRDGGFKLYKKSENGNDRQFELELLELYDYEYNISYYSEKNKPEGLGDSIIETESLPSFSIDEFSEQNVSLYYRKQNSVFQLDYFNNTYFTVRTFQYEERYNENIRGREYKWNLVETEFYNYFIINVKESTQIVVFVKHDEWGADIEGFIANGNNGLIAKLDGQSFTTQIEDKETTKQLKKLTSTYNYIDRFANLYRVARNNELRDLVFNEQLIEEKYDTLYLQNGFVIGKKKREYHVYNLKLKIISPKNTRAVFTAGDTDCQILVNNQIKWLNKEGLVSKSKAELTYFVCGTVRSVKREITRNGSLFQMTEEVDEFDGSPPKTVKYKLPWTGKEYETYFLNGSKTLIHDGNSDVDAQYKLPSTAYNYFIVQQDNKFILLEYFFGKDGVHSQQKLLPGTYDLIKSESYYSPILFQRGEKFGYYPINKTVRYSTLQKFTGAFARFSLENGKKGWLDVYGNEYMDE